MWKSLFASVVLLLSCTFTHAQEVQSLILRIKAVGKEGAGNVEASKAFKDLVAMGPSVMPEVLTGMNDASPVALNWLRAAVESIQDKAMQQNQPLPTDKLTNASCAPSRLPRRSSFRSSSLTRPPNCAAKASRPS
jgi:hypothetical protein